MIDNKDRFKFRFFEYRTKTLYQWDDIAIEKDQIFIEDGGYYVSLENGDLIQCTGLKDKNGKLIYEGDILETEFGQQVVHHDSENTGFNPFVYMYFEQHSDSTKSEEFKIIGNRFKNPELLKDVQ